MRCLFVGLLAGVTANCAPVQFQSSENQTALLELYTSEGCSSCPPAESWLSRLKGQPGLWRDFVPVAFHVDYWDYLGWPDKWASRQFSDRQRSYAGAWGSANYYTPEFVLNGQEWRKGFGQDGVPGMSATKAGILKAASQDSSHWQVKFVPAAGGITGYEVNAALLVCGLASQVKAENAGRHLQHDFVVLTLVHQPLARATDGFRGAFTMAAGVKTPGGRLALAVWVTGSGGREAGASRGRLACATGESRGKRLKTVAVGKPESTAKYTARQAATKDELAAKEDSQRNECQGNGKRQISQNIALTINPLTLRPCMSTLVLGDFATLVNLVDWQ